MPPLDATSQTNKPDPSESTGGAPPPDTAPDSTAFDAAASEARASNPPPADPSASSGQPAAPAPASQPGAPAPADPSASSSVGQPPAGTAPTDPSASQTTSEPQDPSASGVGDAVNGTVRNGTDPLEAIQRLDSTGDTAQFNATAEGKVLVPVPTPRGVVQVGGKGQYGYNIGVERTGETGQPPSYDVTFDKRLLAGPQIETGKGMTPEGTRVGAELNFGTADRVRMQFDNPEDAARAVQLLERTALAETARDAARLTDPSLSNPAGNPLNGSESSDNNTNAQDSYAPGGDLNPATHLRNFADQVAPSAADQQFLQDHVTGYGQEVSGQLRVRAEAKFGQFGLEGRLDGNTRVMREVTLPQDGQPGTLSYSIENGVELTAKEKVDLTDGLFTGQIFHNNGELGVVANNVVDIGQVNNRLTLSWDLPDSAFAGGGQPFPDADVLGNEALHPDRVSLSTTAEGTIQNPLDPSRTDLVRGESTISLDNPDHHAMELIKGGMRGDIRGALNGLSQDVEASQTAEIVRRDGSQTQTEIGVKVDGIGEAKGSLILELGNDDVVSRATRSTPPPADPTTPTDPADPTDPSQPAQPEQVVVVPHDGLNVRAEPGADAARNGVLSHGTFAQPTGQTATDVEGRPWIEVTSTDTNDRPVTGWVAQEYTQAHPQGAMDATGRMNPELEAAGYREVKVAEGDTVWDIAKREGADFQETVALNQDHLIDPNMIFEGDTVYVPGTGRPPVAEPPAEPPAPPVQDPSGSSDSQPAPSDPSGSSGSQPAPSDPSSSSGSQPAPSDPSSSSGSQPAPTNPTDSQPSDPSSSTGGQPTPPPSDPSSSSGSQPVPTNPTEGQPANTAGRPDIAGIENQYRVASDGNELVDFQAKILGISVPGGSVEGITPTESRLLGNLGPLELNDFKGVVDGAREKAAEVYSGDGHPTPPGIGEENRQSWVYNDGHQDAFRHAYWNATMAKHQGADFAEQYATAHEALPADKVNQTRETMDLYNNEVGRRIQAENPDASDGELATLVQQSIERGEMLVVDSHGNLAWSDQVPVGEHGRAPAGGDRPGGMNVPAGDASES
ncbi:LysM peptidoglycan-binding domain-containing protein [Roseomonas hellenica]|uniref:LysM peptidoglycan-binding domain-containing protein n=1 Tax=Plastoroseomonas hellenica TaxID=2687306 RepID=A0ABS5ERJ1_9PROT|nr:LysM peptidoglycan-binding domain-containing protein [Plastoroseomonas hellenica]MBR0662904.1 LysM peptidoglycan-binding domain-containing protein [Plastoroseomonas hellenica]